ncbi:very short patch repair endonuclease [Pseudorhodoplanes sp.]|uniref:very short patch repair endonuclease n=1 Tax=Pseudorhodoplanes sp. TaxID=1934341 RepID=UPI003D0CEE91
MADNLTREQRSFTMSRIRSRDTRPELTIRRLAHARGLRFRKHKNELPGCPDLVFAGAKVVVFVDGDFWHGWRFPAWKGKLGPYWKQKIDSNRRRDKRNFQRLRRNKWLVIRLWEHKVEADAEGCIDLIVDAIHRRTTQPQFAADDTSHFPLMRTEPSPKARP